jgi:L-alanine-DL-glutamate epimerase-like enolase superfamily enzyme
MKITNITTRAFRLPLKERLASSKVTMTHRELVMATLTTDTGPDGVGWFTTAGVGALAARALIDSYLTPFVIGEDPRHNERIWQRLWSDCHAAGPGGITTLALSAIDIALWDIKAKAANEPLHRMLGGARQNVGVYASAINLHLGKDALLAQVDDHLRQGYTAFKLKVGHPEAEEDLDRCRAVRGLIGRRTLMLDANQNWSAGEAVRRCRMLGECVPLFIEEPLPSDDVAGHAHVRACGGVPVALGEQLCNRFEFWNYVRADAVDYLQPDVGKVGGITEWRRIAALAQCASLTLSPHGVLELSMHLAAATPNCGMVENIFGLNLFDLGATTAPPDIRSGTIALSDSPGHGIVFDGPALAANEIHGTTPTIKRESVIQSGL